MCGDDLERINACIDLLDCQYKYREIIGEMLIDSDGMTIIENYQLGVRLTAWHKTGKLVDFEDADLYAFFEELSMEGVGIMWIYEEVDYEFVEIPRHEYGTKGS